VLEAENNDQQRDSDNHLGNHTIEQEGSFAIPLSRHNRSKSSDLSSQISGSWSSSILATSPPRQVIIGHDDATSQPSQPISLLSKLEEAASISHPPPRKHNTFSKHDGSLGIDSPGGVAIVKPERSLSTPMKTKFGSPLSQTSVFITPSPPQSPSLGGQEIRHPYKLLHDIATHLHKRLNGTEIRVLNRRLHRAFDMLKLTDLSNSIIDNVNQDIQALDSRFAWVQQGVKDQEQVWAQETIALSSFFVTVKLVQDLLAEIGILRTTLNSLQVEYVNKVNENQSFVEKALEEQAESSNLITKPTTESAGAFAWLSSMIYRTSGSNASVKNSDDDSVHTAASGTDDTSDGGNTSSISYLSNSIYRIASSFQAQRD
jgi:hypothetical protein